MTWLQIAGETKWHVLKYEDYGFTECLKSLLLLPIRGNDSDPPELSNGESLCKACSVIVGIEALS